MKNHNPFQGLICPMLTPFDAEGQLDLPAVYRLVEHLIEQGIDCLLPAGTTGEGMLLTLEEHRRLAEAVVEAAAGKVAVVVHTGRITTAETVALTRHAAQIGADGASIITPYFFAYDDQALFEHYLAVAKAVPDFPISLYCYPGNAKNEITPALLLRLRQVAPNVMAIKLSDVNLVRFQEYALVGGEGFNPLCGVDALALAALSVGSCGQVSGNSNVFPLPFRRLLDAFSAGNLAEARRQQQAINRVRAILKDSLAHFKAAMRLLGMPVGEPRPPLRRLSPTEMNELERGLRELDLS